MPKRKHSEVADSDMGTQSSRLEIDSPDMLKEIAATGKQQVKHLKDS